MLRTAKPPWVSQPRREEAPSPGSLPAADLAGTGQFRLLRGLWVSYRVKVARNGSVPTAWGLRSRPGCDIRWVGAPGHPGAARRGRSRSSGVVTKELRADLLTRRDRAGPASPESVIVSPEVSACLANDDREVRR